MVSFMLFHFTLFCSGWVTPAFDTKFVLAYIFSISAIVLGGSTWLTLLLGSGCNPPEPPKCQCNRLGWNFLWASLFQILSVMIRGSNVCEDIRFFDPYLGEDLDFFASVKCKRSTGGNFAFRAAVLWVASHSFVVCAVGPFRYYIEPHWLQLIWKILTCVHIDTSHL